MMQGKKINVKELINSLAKKGVILWEEKGKLKYKSPQGVINKEDLQTLKEYKEEILSFLQGEKKEFVVEVYPENKYEPFPLTDIQSAYLLGRNDVFGYGGVACHIYLEINYESLEHKKSERIWNQLVLRHDMLRATIDKNGYQQVLEKVPSLQLPYSDISGLKEEELKEKLVKIREDMGHRVYDTENWPLFSVAITKTPSNAILHFSIEFLIADWASIWLLLSEFEDLYYNPEKEFADLNLTFRDYLIAEKRLKESITYYNDKEYWMKRIDSLPPAPKLPVLNKEKSESQPIFKRHTVLMDDKKWNEFKDKAKKYGVTPTVAVMSSYASVIERWSSSNKFCLNLTVLNRLPLHQQVNDIVGDFTSISLLDIEWGYNNSFIDNAKKISGQLFDDLDHRLFSGVEVLREIARRSGRESALMPIVFTSAIGLIKSSEGSEIKGRISEHGISQTPQVFIDCQALDTELGLQVNWDVRQGVFQEGMVEDMFNAFEELLNSLANEDKEWTMSGNIKLPNWQIKQREEMNDTKKSLPKHLLHSGILKQIEINPDKVAVIDSNESITYKELSLRASAIVKKLKEVGCEGQDNVAIIMDKSVHQVESVLGILSVGGVYVPIDTMQPEIRRTEMLKRTDTKFVVTFSTLEINLPEGIKRIDVDKLKPHYENLLQDDGDTKDSCYIIHTSGSTGLPKGVVITHEAAVNTIEDINERFNIKSNDTVLGLAQLSFDLSVYDIFGILSAGGTLVYSSVDRQTDPSHWVDLMIKYGVTVWNSVPALMQMLVTYLNSEGTIELPQLKVAMLSGDWIPLNLPDILLKKAQNVKVISLGGATEASIWSIFYEYKRLKSGWRSIPYGSPLANQEFHVLDKKMRDCPVWVTGELFISGEGLAKEYYGNKEITETSFLYHPVSGQRLYRTGDMGRYTKEDEIEFLGREDNQVKIKGHRIELGEIEAALQDYPSVSSAAVVVEGKDDDRALFAVVEPSNKKQYSKDKERFKRIIDELNIDKDERWNSEDVSLQINSAIDSIGTLIKNIEKENGQDVLKVLILGSSIGKETEVLLKNLDGLNIEYLLTDETEAGVDKLKGQFEKLNNVECLNFNIRKDYREQGISPNNFHIVISNFGIAGVDDISSIGSTLLEILRPEGWLFILEDMNQNGEEHILKTIRKNQGVNKENSSMSKWTRFMKEQGEEDFMCLPRCFKEVSNYIDVMIGQVKQNKEKIVIPELLDFISSRLPGHMVPSAIQVVDSMPLTSNDKVNRRVIGTWKVKSNGGNSHFKKKLSSLDPLQKLLSQIWEEALGISNIDETQSFYDCGADSLIMAQVTGKLRAVLSKPPYDIDIQFDVLLRNMLNHPTICELADFIHTKERKTEKTCNKVEVKDEKTESSNANFIFYGDREKQPLRVIFHEGLGSMGCFKKLIPHLINQNQGSVLGINIDDAEVYSSLEPENVIETIAEDYANRLIKMGCKDMQFIGYSLGGTIAVEVARRIVENGINLTDLIIIDPHQVPLTIEDELILEMLFISNLNLTMERVGFNWVDERYITTGLAKIIENSDGKVSSGASLSASGDENLDKVGEFFKALSKIPQKERFIRYAEAASIYNGEEMPSEIVERLFKIFSQSYKAAQFKPMPYFGDIRMALSKEPFPLFPEINQITQEFWSGICLGDLSVKEIEGNHFTCIATEPNVTNLAKEIGAIFAK